jgi:acyl-CoA oxidase
LCIHSPDTAAGKEYIGNALHSSMAAVFAQLYVNNINHGVHAILVPLRDTQGKLLKGIKIEDCGHKLGLNGVDNGRIWFDNVNVPRENLLDKYGTITNEGQYESTIENPSARFFTMLGALVVGRICVASASINASKKAISIAIKYAHKRRQFGPSDDEPESLIMDYPTHQERLIPKLASLYAYHFALIDLKEQYVKNDGTQTRRIETLAAGLKAKSTWLTTDLIQECREACGGKGYLSENQIDALKADTDIFTTFEGDNTVLMQLVAKGLLTEYKQSFHDGGLKAVISYLAKKAKYKLNEYNSFTKGNTDYSHLTSDEFLETILQYRYEKHLISLGDRMKKYLERRVNPYQAFLKTQIHMVDLADAYIDHLVGSSFKKHIEQQEDIQIKKALQTIWQLYTLDIVYKQRGWYLENDIIGGEKSKAIRRARQHLIQVVNADSIALVKAFAIPDELIAAPIALKAIS